MRTITIQPTMATERTIRRQRSAFVGASLIEFLIVFPIVLLVMFIIIHVSIAINGKTALQSAVSNAARLAFTRGNPAALGANTGVIAKLDTFYTDGTTCTDLDDVFMAGDIASWPNGCVAAALHYGHDAGCDVFQCGGACGDITQYPLYYFYFVAYASLGMRQALGGAVRFPCDPSDPDLGDGCFMCRFLNPAPTDLTLPNPECETYDLVTRGPPPAVYVRCSYRPVSQVLRPIYALLRQSTGDSSWGMMEVEWHYP